MSLAPLFFHDHAFSSIEYHGAEGLTLSICSCAGSATHYVPRSKIHHISVGREMWIWTLLGGMALLAYGLYYKLAEHVHPGTFEVASLYMGIVVILFAMVKMIQQTITISTKMATFSSAMCCGEADALMHWMRAPAGAVFNQMVLPAVSMSSAFMAPQQQQPQYAPQISPVDRPVYESMNESPSLDSPSQRFQRGATLSRREQRGSVELAVSSPIAMPPSSEGSMQYGSQAPQAPGL